MDEWDVAPSSPPKERLRRAPTKRRKMGGGGGKKEKQEGAGRVVGLASGLSGAGGDVGVNEGRGALVEELIRSLGLCSRLQRIPVHPCHPDVLLSFHSPDYVAALALEQPSSLFGLEMDCFPFPGVFQHALHIAGSTLDTLQWIASQTVPAVGICWQGGRHHARSSAAAGYCFVNDIILAILQAKRLGYRRIAYVDLDVHHGDGVQDAIDEDVLFISTHLYEPGFFPYPSGGEETGDSHNILNIPLKRGASDTTFSSVLLSKVMPRMLAFQPDLVILQLGADGLAGDPLGGFNLTSFPYCLATKEVIGMPGQPDVLMLGGGGYDNFLTAKCWAACCHVALGGDFEEFIASFVPETNEHFVQFRPNLSLRIHTLAMIDKNLPPGTHQAKESRAT